MSKLKHFSKLIKTAEWNKVY